MLCKTTVIPDKGNGHVGYYAAAPVYGVRLGPHHFSNFETMRDTYQYDNPGGRTDVTRTGSIFDRYGSGLTSRFGYNKPHRFNRLPKGGVFVVFMNPIPLKMLLPVGSDGVFTCFYFLRFGKTDIGEQGVFFKLRRKRRE